MKTTTEPQLQDHVLLIEEVGKGRIINAADILYLEANNNYCNLYLKNNQKIIVCRTLRSFQDELNSNIFFRCHKSFLVNVQYIREYIFKGNEYVIILQDQTILQVARRRMSDLKKFLEVKIKSYQQQLPLTK